MVLLKQISILTILSLALSKSNAQDSCMSENVQLLKRIIEKNIPVNGEDYSNLLSEYFIIDIRLDKERNTIENIDFYRKNNSSHYKSIEKSIKKIKEPWGAQSCGYTRVLIPVFLLFSSAAKLYDSPVEFDLKSIRNNANNKVYLFDTIVINIFSRVQKKQ